MTALEDALAIDASSPEQTLVMAVDLLTGSSGVVLLEGMLVLRRDRGALVCEVIDPAPGSRRCEEEFKVLVENARRTLDRSKLGAMLPQKPMRWAVVEYDGAGPIEVWPGG